MNVGTTYLEFVMTLLLIVGFGCMAFVGVVWLRFDKRLRTNPKVETFPQEQKRAALWVFLGGFGAGLCFAIIWLVGTSDPKGLGFFEILIAFSLLAGGSSTLFAATFLISSSVSRRRYEYYAVDPRKDVEEDQVVRDQST